MWLMIVLANGVVERLHSILKSRLMRVKMEHPTLPLSNILHRALVDIPSTPHEMTGCTPFEGLAGRTMRTPLSSISPAIPKVQAYKKRQCGRPILQTAGLDSRDTTLEIECRSGVERVKSLNGVIELGQNRVGHI